MSHSVTSSSSAMKQVEKATTTGAAVPSFVTQPTSGATYPAAGGQTVTTTETITYNNGPTAYTTTSAVPAYSTTTVTEPVRRTSNVVRREVGEQRLVSVTERVDESRSHILSERMEEHEIRVPKKIVREEIIEKVIIVPEKQIVTEEIEDTVRVQEKVIEVAKPTIREKVIEIPEIEYVEKIVEVPKIVRQTKVVPIDRPVERTRVVERPIVVKKDRVVEVPVIEYKDVVREKPVTRYEDVEHTVWEDVEVPQYKDIRTPVTVEVPEYVDLNRKLPVPVEAEVTYEYRIPQIKPKYAKVAYPVYLPRFIEVPVAAELLDPQVAQQAEAYLAKVGSLTKTNASLCEIENLAASIKTADIQTKIAQTDLPTAVVNAWKSGTLQGISTAPATTTTTYSSGIPMAGTTTTTVTREVTTAGQPTVYRPATTVSAM